MRRSRAVFRATPKLRLAAEALLNSIRTTGGSPTSRQTVDRRGIALLAVCCVPRSDHPAPIITGSTDGKPANPPARCRAQTV
jgi:hypothetical protein